jgi:hypothetical protein
MIDRRFIAMTAAATLLALTGRAHAAPTPEERCHGARHKAAGKYAACQAKVQAKTAEDGSFDFNQAAGKCRDKYRAVWPKLQATLAATSCAAPRFIDNGDGTVTDNLTALTWEKKTDDGSVHDKDDFHTWTTSGDGDFANADGTAFTTFLSALNGGGCFAAHCDWRLPTREEFQTILLEPYPCNVSPCIDPIFGLTNAGNNHWTSTSHVTNATSAWFLDFDGGSMLYFNKSGSHFVRGVRGGL